MFKPLVVAILVCLPVNLAWADLAQNDVEQKTVECQSDLDGSEYTFEYERITLSSGAKSSRALIRKKADDDTKGFGGESYYSTLTFPGEFNGRRGRWSVDLQTRAGDEPIALVAFRGTGAAGSLTWSVQCLTK